MDELLIRNDKLDFAYYSVGKYDDLCEEHFKIEKIIPIKKTTSKKVIDIIINILTVGLIQFIYGGYPALEKKIKYVNSSLEECELLYIHCSDGKCYFINIIKCVLPKIKNHDILLPEINYSLELILFKFKLFTYIFNSKTNKFDSLKFEIFRTRQEVLETMIKGLTDDEREYQANIYGECNLNFYIRSFLETVYDNMCDFFFFFQVFCLVLWCITDFMIYAAVVAALVVYNLIDSSLEIRRNLLNIRKMSKYSIDINLYQKNKIKEISSETLVPGDIFELPADGTAVPCDCILLSGSVIVNEAMLTGESTPIIKAHLPLSEDRFNYEANTKHMLFSGTKIVQKRPENKKPILCLCYATGFNTVRGNLIRSVLYPTEGDTSFMRDSINVLKIVCGIFIVGFFFILPKKIKTLFSGNKKSMLEAIFSLLGEICDLLTQAVPPELPLCLGICLGIAQKRCKGKHILCINKEKINSAGKIKVCVFDKTGTLTEDHLDIYAYVPITVNANDDINNEENKNFVFGKETKSVKEMAKRSYEYYKDKLKNPANKSAIKEMDQLFIECLACCQGATKVNNKLIGDPIDVEMFEATGWTLVEEAGDPENYNPKIPTFVRPKEEQSLTEKLAPYKGRMDDIEVAEEIDNIMTNHYELGIMRRFDFESKLQRMSSIVKSLTGTSFMCYCKGSPEKISELCQNNTLPDNFTEVLNRYTSQGFRVLALSCKVMQMTYDQAIEIPRELAEKDLIFLGLLIVQNQLKEATSGILKSLSEKGHLRVRMATGDNILTAICVSRKSNLIPPDSIVYSCDIEEEVVNDDKDINDEDDNEYNRSGIQKEKKKIKKLKWNTVESFKDFGNEEEAQIIPRKISINDEETLNKALNVLIPQEIDEDNDIIDTATNKISAASSNKKSVKIDMTEEYNNINIDLNDIPFTKKDDENIIIAISGKTFEMLYYMNQKYESQNDGDDFGSIMSRNTQREMSPEKLSLRPFHEAFRLILRYCSVYARCSPDNKTQLVQSLQKEGFQVLMCGDGANDCGALKAADVGVSLSQEEASIAAPFTSTNPDITCIIDVLNQGKCALVTSVEIFKYMIAFSLTEFIAMSLMMFRDNFLTDFESIVIDCFITLPLCTFLPMTEAYETFNYHRPFSTLASFPVFISVFFQVVLNGLFQFFGYFLMDHFFPITNEKNIPIYRKCKTIEDNEEKQKPCLDNSMVFYVSFCQYLFVGLVLITAAPFKKRIYTNIPLFLFVIVCFIYVFYIIIYNDKFSYNRIKIMGFPDDDKEIIDLQIGLPFKYYVAIYCLLNLAICFFFEKVVVSYLIKYWSKREFKKNQKTMKKIDTEVKLNLINDVKNYVREHKKKIKNK
jgi:cation-transporting ATPase 13A3/4/5